MRRTSFDRRVLSTEAVKKAAYVFIDRFSAQFEIDGDSLVCTLQFVNGIPEDAEDGILQVFEQEVLDYDLRESIGRETADVRNAILALALRPSGLIK